MDSDLFDEDDGWCTWCGGDGWEECGDRLQCMEDHAGTEHPCSACNGTGDRASQTVF